MAYGMGQLRKAGDLLNRLDQGYSQKIVDMYMGPEDKPRSYTDNPVLGTAAGIGAIFGGGTPMKRMDITGDNDRRSLMENSAAVSSAVAKYGAPLAGAGLALQGISATFGGQADMPESNQLPLQ